RVHDSYAHPDFTAVLRMRLDGDRLTGMVCRARPQCSQEDAAELLDWIGLAAEESFEEPRPAISEIPKDVSPLLKELDDAGVHDDHERAAKLIEELRPYLVGAPLSRFALNVHVTEGWVHKRRAFSGDEAAATRAIDVLRSTSSSIDARRHPDL